MAECPPNRNSGNPTTGWNGTISGGDLCLDSYFNEDNKVTITNSGFAELFYFWGNNNEVTVVNDGIAKGFNFESSNNRVIIEQSGVYDGAEEFGFNGKGNQVTVKDGGFAKNFYFKGELSDDDAYIGEHKVTVEEGGRIELFQFASDKNLSLIHI